MAYMDSDKKYFTIGEVAARFGVATSAIRFWEQEFATELRVKRNNAGRRVYTRDNVEILGRICYLVRDRGLRIEAAREVLRTRGDNVAKQQRVVERLTQVRDELSRLAEGLRQRNFGNSEPNL